MMRGMGPGSMARGGPGGPWTTGEKVKLQTSVGTVVRRLGSVVAEHRRLLWYALITILISSAFQMVPPWAIRHVIDNSIPTGQSSQIWAIGFALIALHAARFALLYWNRVTIAIVSQQLVYAMAQRLFTHIQRLSLRFYERQGTGDIISRTTSDIGTLQQALTGMAVNAAVGVINMFAYGVVMLWLDWRLALVVFSSVPLLIVASYVTGELLRVRYQRVQEKMSGVNAVLAENITGVRVSKAFAKEGQQNERFTDKNRENLRANMATATVQSIATPVIQVIAGASTALVLLVGSNWVMSGSLTLGTLIAFVSYLVAFYQPVEELIRVNNVIQQALASAERIFQFMDEVPDIGEKPGAVDLVAPRGHVRFESVGFGYVAGQPVLHRVDVDAPPGKVVALVGHTGSGKTSLVNLIPRFYDVSEGRVTIDGHDVRDLTLASLRSAIGVVLQETFLFSGTIRDNIRYGRLDATDDEVEWAAREAHAHEFIARFPLGYDAPVGEGGVMLSRGQRQRLSLARAILKDPRVLILDEATSDVDTETEVLIQRALERVRAGRTVFVIAHRLSTIRSADEILVLDHGVIVERGRHEELLARGGTYQRLHDVQFADRATVSAAGLVV